MQQIKNILNKPFFFIVILSVLGFVACKPTRLIEDGDYLLKKNTTTIQGAGVNKAELESYYRQKPNKKLLLLFKFNLAAYNFSKRGRETKIKNWVGRVIGEEPVVFDSVLVDRTKQQFERYLKNESFYKSKVIADVTFLNKKARVNYTVIPNEPMPVNFVAYNIKDTALTDVILKDTTRSKLKVNALFTLDMLQNERNRISQQLKDSGYYNFNVDYVKFSVDTSNYHANITIDLDMALKRKEGITFVREPHKKYWIRDVYFYPDYDPHRSIRDKENYINIFDTMNYKGYKFIYPGFVNVRPKVILKAGDLEYGQLYSLSDVNSTSKYLNSLRIYRLNNINFTEINESDSVLDCHIRLTPFAYQNYSVNFETTTTGGNAGIGGALKYEHKNIFRGAEIFRIKLSGSNQFVTKTEDRPSFNILEAGAEVSLELPSFLIPFRSERFYKRYNPKTNFSVSALYQLRPDYDRLVYSSIMGYNWHSSATSQHSISPIDLSTVKVNATDDFYNRIKGTYLENNYKDYFIAGGRYTYIYQSKKSEIKSDYIFYRWNVEVAGNLLNAYDNIVPSRDTAVGGYYTILGLQYAQFAKTDMDWRYYQGFGNKNSMVYRLFGGAALPYGNAKAVPFIRQYYGGGAEGMRAWQVKDLGPGSYVQDSGFPNQTSDIKLEFNIEHRYNIFGSFNAATFIDVGNIWSITEEDDREGAVFKFDRFYKQFAIGTGIGLRYDIRFAVIRLDVGIKVRDPSLSGSESWILFNRPFHYNQINWNFAIGYPF